jgi:hypothetical protein
MPENPRKPQHKRKLSRRDFGRGALLTTAAAAVPDRSSAKAAVLSQSADSPSAQLSPEAEAHFRAIINKHGSRLSEEQRADVKRLLGSAQKTSDALRGFALENSDEPANIFRIYRADRVAGGRR